MAGAEEGGLKGDWEGSGDEEGGGVDWGQGLRKGFERLARIWARFGVVEGNGDLVGGRVKRTSARMLRTGRVSVVIRRLVHHSWYGPAGERLSWAGTSWKGSAGQEPAGKAQLDRDQLYRTRQVLDRKGFLMSISISSLPR